MKFSHSTSLSNFNTKKLGLVIALAFLTVELVIKIKGVVDENINVKLANLCFLLSLWMIVFSKEKVDDERFLAIRYYSFKKTIHLFLIAVMFDYMKGFKIAPIYFAIGTLMGYLIIYYFCVLFNPEFIFKEKTYEDKGNWRLLLVALFFIGLAFHILSEIMAI